MSNDITYLVFFSITNIHDQQNKTKQRKNEGKYGDRANLTFL